MHEAVRQFVKAHLPKHYYSVLEVGSLDINGGVRDLLDPQVDYLGIDVQDGPGVDLIADFSTYRGRKVDLVLCLEVLEHTPKWREIIEAAKESLKPGGTLIVTCATANRAPHSARGTGPIQDDEHYQNIEKEEMSEVLLRIGFSIATLQVLGNDLRVVARAPVSLYQLPWSAIIPSRDGKNLKGCIESLREMHPDLPSDRIVIVSDGLPPRERRRHRGCTWVDGIQPFVFSRAINMGAKAAGENDLLILGDDVRIRTGGLGDLLQSRTLADFECMAVSPRIHGVCGQPAQRVGAISPALPWWLAFICVFIPRWVWNTVGPLDERFTGYGYDDVDWCVRAKDYGRVEVAYDCEVDHIDRSSFRRSEGWMQLYDQNRKIFNEKWGANVP